MANDRILIGSDMNLTMDRTRDVNGTYKNAGTWTWRVTDRSGDELGSGTLAYVAASDGKYTGTIDRSVTILCVYGGTYFVYVSFVEGNFEKEVRLRCKAVYSEDDLP